MDLGHLTLKRGTNPNVTGTDLVSLKDAKVTLIRLSFYLMYLSLLGY